jgi:hypothetical protein
MYLVLTLVHEEIVFFSVVVVLPDPDLLGLVKPRRVLKV